MNRNQAKVLLPIIQAYAEGKAIESRCIKGDTSLWHDLKEEKPQLRKWVMFRYSGGGVNPTSLHHGAMSDDVWIVTRGDGTHRIEALYECYDKIEWLDFDELK